MALQHMESFPDGVKRSRSRCPYPDRRPSEAPPISHHPLPDSQHPPGPSMNDEELEVGLCLMMLVRTMRGRSDPREASMPDPCTRENASTLDPRPPEKASTSDPHHEDKVSTPMTSNLVTLTTDPRREEKLSIPMASHPVASTSDTVPTALNPVLSTSDLLPEEKIPTPMASNPVLSTSGLFPDEKFPTPMASNPVLSTSDLFPEEKIPTPMASNPVLSTSDLFPEEKIPTPMASNPVASSPMETGNESEDKNLGLVPVPLRGLPPSKKLKLEQDGGRPTLLPPRPLPPLQPPRQSKEPSYPCQCGKTFTSYQALGGHKTSHRRKPIPARNNAPNGHDGQTTSVSASAVPSTAPARLLGDGKIHRCRLCTKEFSTGQALGGHMRFHFDPSAAARASTATLSTTPAYVALASTAAPGSVALASTAAAFTAPASAAAPRGEGSGVMTSSCDAVAPSSERKRTLDLNLNELPSPPPEAVVDGQKEEDDGEVKRPLTNKPCLSITSEGDLENPLPSNPLTFFDFFKIPKSDS